MIQCMCSNGHRQEQSVTCSHCGQEMVSHEAARLQAENDMMRRRLFDDLIRRVDDIEEAILINDAKSEWRDIPWRPR